MSVTCPYCGKPAQLVTGNQLYKGRMDLRHKMFWRCNACDAHVGCHEAGSGTGYAHGDGTVPLGRMANAELRLWKGNAHAVFDPYWKNKVEAEILSRKGHAPKGVKMRHRTAAYERLAKELNIPMTECHFGMFDVDMCKRAVRIVRGWIGANPI